VAMPRSSFTRLVIGPHRAANPRCGCVCLPATHSLPRDCPPFRGDTLPAMPANSLPTPPRGFTSRLVPHHP
jgi:hypothetical protein